MAQKSKKIDATIVNSVTLGDIWGITDRRVRKLAEEGVIEAVSRGKYDLASCTKRYCAYLRQAAESSEDKKNAKLDYDTEKALHEKIKREKSELQLKVMRGELHKAEDVDFVMTDMITKAKMKLLAIPSKAADLVIGRKDINSIENIIQKMIEEALVELSDYNSDLFKNDEVIEDDSDE